MLQDVHGHVRDGKFRSLIIHFKILKEVQKFLVVQREKKTSRVLLLKEERAFEHE